MGCQQSSLESCIEQLAGKDAEQVASACDKLRGSVQGKDAATCRAAEAGAIEALVEAMKRHQKNATLQTQACRTMYLGFMYCEEWMAKAAEVGTMEALVNALTIPAVNVQYAIWGLQKLCQGSNPAAVERRARAVELGLVDLLQKLPASCTDLARKDAEEVINLLRHPGWERIPSKSMMEKGCNAHDVAKACEDFGNFLCHEEAKREAFSTGALGNLISVMECLTSPRAQAMASFALAKLCHDAEDGKAEERRSEATELGALEALVKALKTHSGDAKVQEYASLALGNICRGSKERAAKAAHLGAMEAVLNGLRTHPQIATVQQRGSLALTNICRDSEDRAAKAAGLGALEVTVKALKNHRADVAVQEYASTSLGTLCYDSEERRSRALGLSAFDLMAGALPQAEPVTILQRHRYWALGILCLGEDEEAPSRRRRALELGVLVQMQKMRNEKLDVRNTGLAAKAQAVIDVLQVAPPRPAGQPWEEISNHKAGPSMAPSQIVALASAGQEDASGGSGEEQREASSRMFLQKLQDMAQAGRDSETSTIASSADPSLAYVSERTTVEAKKASEALASHLPAERAEKQLRAAMKSRDPEQMKLAIQAAKAAKVRAEVLLEAHEALLVAGLATLNHNMWTCL